MKKAIFTSLFSSVAALAFAEVAGNAPCMLDQRLKLQQSDDNVLAATEVSTKSVFAALSENRLLSEQELRQFAQASKLFQLDSIVGSTDNGTQRNQRQYFMYNDKKIPVKRLNSYWDSSTGQWDTVETYEFVWDEDGWCLEQSAYSETAGQKYVFEYNDRHLGIVQILYTLQDGKWVPQQRGDYKYDDGTNIIEEVISQWVQATSEWSKVVKNTATWDNLNRQTSFAKYKWTGSEWVGDGEKKLFEYIGDAPKLYSMNGWCVWDEQTKDWFWFMKREFFWNDKGQSLGLLESYFNKDTNKWDGCYEWYGRKMYNKKTVINYDSKYRITDETYSEEHEIGTFTPMSDIIRTWSDLKDGISQEVAVTKTLRSNREPWAENIIVQDSTIKQYNPAGSEIYSEEWHIRGASGPLYRYQKFVKTYDANGYLASEYQYARNNQNLEEWLPTTGINYVNDKEGRKIEQNSVKWQKSDSTWVNNNRFTYKYENGVQTEELAYRWRNEEWTPNYGTGQFYDFGVMVNSLVLWPGADFIYKLNEVRSYSANGNDWNYFANVYHYSDIKDSGIDGIADSQVKISYSRNVVTVNGEGEITTRIFDAAGRCVIATAERSIDLSAYAPGLYIIKSGDASKKIVK